MKALIGEAGPEGASSRCGALVKPKSPKVSKKRTRDSRARFGHLGKVAIVPGKLPDSMSTAHGGAVPR